MIAQQRKSDTINARIKPLPNEQGRFVCECGSTFGTWSAGVNAQHTTSARHIDFLEMEALHLNRHAPKKALKKFF